MDVAADSHVEASGMDEKAAPSASFMSEHELTFEMCMYAAAEVELWQRSPDPQWARAVA